MWNLVFKISDDEKPAVTFTISETEIAENGGSTTVTAEISNPKINPVLVNFDLQGSSLIGEDYNSTSIIRFSRLAGSVNNQGVADGNHIFNQNNETDPTPLHMKEEEFKKACEAGRISETSY